MRVILYLSMLTCVAIHVHYWVLVIRFFCFLFCFTVLPSLFVQPFVRNEDWRTDKVNYRVASLLKTVLLAPICRRNGLTKLILILWLYILKFVEKLIYYDTIFNFSVWLRTGSNPADINRFGSHTGKFLVCMFIIIIYILPIYC